MEGQGDPVAPKIDPAHPGQNDFLCYSLDLFNHGYFWESHVYFEALWNAHAREGDIADFLKGMIKLGAAGVKGSLEQPENARDHLKRARQLFAQVRESQGEVFLGFSLSGLIETIDRVLDKEVKYMFEVHPNWES